jgi:uncharacterized low-complexity protein
MSKKSLLATAVGTAFAASLAAPVVSAADNPFALSSLASGYQVADNQTVKPMEGKCGEGMCGAKMKSGTCGMFMTADTNKDGKISKEEWNQQHDAIFSKMDANKDGFIDQSEMGRMANGKCDVYKSGAPEGKGGAAK